MGLRWGFFYGVVDSSIVWVLQVGLTMGLSVGLGLRYRLLWFWVLGGLGGWAWLENGNGSC